MFYQENSDRITVFDLPTYSPDYNPIEKLWKKIKEREIHLHYFPTFDALKNKVEKALLNFQDCKQEILKLFGFCNELSEQIH
jgi:transposase